MSTTDPLAPVTIGVRQLYDKLETLTAKVDDVRIEVQQVAQTHSEATKDLADHEARLRALERGRWPLPSLAALIALASLIVTLYNALAGG